MLPCRTPSKLSTSVFYMLFHKQSWSLVFSNVSPEPLKLKLLCIWNNIIRETYLYDIKLFYFLSNFPLGVKNPQPYCCGILITPLASSNKWRGLYLLMWQHDVIQTNNLLPYAVDHLVMLFFLHIVHLASLVVLHTLTWNVWFVTFGNCEKGKALIIFCHSAWVNGFF